MRSQAARFRFANRHARFQRDTGPSPRLCSLQNDLRFQSAPPAPSHYLSGSLRGREATHIGLVRAMASRIGASAGTEAAAGRDASQESDQEKLVVLTTLGCPYCRKTKQALGEAGIRFAAYDLSTNLTGLKRVKDATGRDSVPQVFADGRLLGGCDETLKLLESGELQHILQTSSKKALPEDLAEIVTQSTASPSSQEDIESLVLPENMSKARYRELKGFEEGMSSSLCSGSQHGYFEAAAACQWLIKRGHAGDESAGYDVIKDLLDAHLLTCARAGPSEREQPGNISPKSRLAAVSEALKDIDPKKTPLNAAFRWRRKARPASKVAETLRQIILRLYEKHLSGDGKNVDYAALKGDDDFRLFVVATAELQAVDATPLTREERIAFFLNIYNVLIVHAQTALGGPSNFFQRLTWFSKIKYEIGGQEYSVDALEHGVLRGNRPTAASLSVLLGHPEWSKGFFKPGDPRLKQVVRPMDKRIHFALNCGARSCPPIKVYTPEGLEQGLQSAATAFCEGEVEVDEENRIVHLSKLFKWYAMDFGAKKELLAWLRDVSPDETGGKIDRLLRREDGGDVELKYKDYDWSLNQD